MISQALQIESKAPACTECQGHGTLPVKPVGGLDVEIWGCGEEVCPRCNGSRVECCESCGDPATHLRYDGDFVPTQPFCDECDPEEPSDDHPLGGMGYGIDYADAMASGRLLK